MRVRSCQYGVFTHRCGKHATTKRLRPSGDSLWDVCEWHACLLDRLRGNMAEHAHLLDALRDA
jgi:hypothetical protein